MRYGLVLFVFLLSCARAPITSPSEAMRLSNATLNFHDDLDFPSLVKALEANVRQLRQSRDMSRPMDFGPRQIDRELYAKSMEWLLVKAKEDPSGETFRRALLENFEPYEVYGQEDWGQVFITSYFEPVIDGALKKSERFSQPLYGVPKDLVLVDLKTFDGLPDRVLRGRMLTSTSDEDQSRVVAFPDRAEIQEQSLRDAPILAWVDPIDAFFLEIQGSGAVRLKDGRQMRVGYAAQNGRPYVAIGKHLIGTIPKEKITLHSIEAHLRSLPPEESRKLMNMNPSYVFFRKLQTSGVTYFGTEVVGGRTIATDQNYFPKGALAYLEFEKPRFNSENEVEPTTWERSSRFVLDQDIGGAIRGPARVDLFWGKGGEAKQSAGVIKGAGRLTYLVPRPELLQQLSTTAPNEALAAPKKR